MLRKTLKTDTMQIIFATGNKGKLREAREILGDAFEIIGQQEAGVTEEVEETGETLRDNSILKAEYIRKKTGSDCFADDTGLEVDCLDGAPGVYTARYAGEDCNFDDNMNKLLEEMAKKPGAPRTARFKSVITLMLGEKTICFEGCLEGVISLEKAGCGGFGYDPVFIPTEEPTAECPFEPGLTLAEIGEDAKNSISHRGKALRKMAEYLKNNL